MYVSEAHAYIITVIGERVHAMHFPLIKKMLYKMIKEPFWNFYVLSSILKSILIKRPSQV